MELPVETSVRPTSGFKPEKHCLRRRLVILLTDEDFQRVRSAAQCESMASYVRSLIRQDVRE